MHDALDDLPISPYARYKADRTFMDAVTGAAYSGNTVPNLPLTDQLGPHSLHFADEVGGPGSAWYEFDPGAVRVPEMPRSGLVSTSKELRPHRNTALGRWYARAITDPSKQYVSDVIPISDSTVDWDVLPAFDTDDPLPF